MDLADTAGGIGSRLLGTAVPSSPTMTTVPRGITELGFIEQAQRGQEWYSELYKVFKPETTTIIVTETVTGTIVEPSTIDVPEACAGGVPYASGVTTPVAEQSGTRVNQPAAAIPEQRPAVHNPAAVDHLLLLVRTLNTGFEALSAQLKPGKTDRLPVTVSICTIASPYLLAIVTFLIKKAYAAYDSGVEENTAESRIAALENKVKAHEMVIQRLARDIGKIEGTMPLEGPQGPQGDTGPQGTQGMKGDTGPQGPRGDHGQKGDTGPQGPRGDRGDRGERGERGDRGERGCTGFPGPKGDRGLQGPRGD